MEELLTSCLAWVMFYGILIGAAAVGIIWFLVWLFN